jgi:hypothetical protein
MMPAVGNARAHAAIAAVLAACLGVLQTGAQADQVIADDLIVDGSLCVGLECANGEVFNTGILRMKGNVLRFDMIDTGPAGTSIRDWRIEANSHVGPAGYLSFNDMGNGSTGAEGGTPILQLTAGARANSIFVSSLGRVGLGTATPGQDLHIASGDFPAIIFEQDGSDGDTPRKWVTGGDDFQFVIQDETLAIPFAVRAGAPGAALVIRADGRIGMGAGAEGAPLEVRNTATNIGVGNAVLKLVNPSGPTAMQMQPFGTGFFWNFAASDNDTFNINRSGNSAVEMSLNGSGNLTISGTLTTGGPTCSTGCDAVFDADYALPSIEDHAAAMWAKKHLPNVGPTLPHQPVNLSEQYGRMLNELETAHIYIAQLDRRNVDLAMQIKREREAYEARLARLESVLAQTLD